MENFKNILLVCVGFISLPIASMEAPPQPMEAISAQASLDALPADVKRLLVPLIASSKVAEVADTILALNRTNKFFHNYLKDPANLIAILERMPYTANATDLIENYLSKTNIPVAKSPQINAWLKNAKSRLVDGSELWMATLRGQQSNVAQFLRNKKINLNFEMPTNNNQTSLFLPSFVIESRKDGPSAVKINEMLIDAGANPNIKDRRGRTALSEVVAESRIKESKEIMNALLRANADPDLAKNSDGETSLIELTKDLVGASEMAKYFRRSPEHISNMKEMLKMLVYFGADPELQDKSGKSARDYAVEYKRSDLVQLFDEAIAKEKEIQS